MFASRLSDYPSTLINRTIIFMLGASLLGLPCCDIAPITAQTVVEPPPDSNSTAAQDPSSGSDRLELNFQLPLTTNVLAQRYRSDRGNLTRYFPIECSPTRWHVLLEFDAQWLVKSRQWVNREWTAEERSQLERLTADIEKQLRQDVAKRQQITLALSQLPFAQPIIDLCEARQRVEPIDPTKLAGQLEMLRQQVVQLKDGPAPQQPFPVDAEHWVLASELVGQLQQHLAEWHSFYDQYDPQYTWWVAAPYQQLDKSLSECAEALSARGKPAADAAPPGGDSQPGSGGAVESDFEKLVAEYSQSESFSGQLDQFLKTAIDQSNSRMQPVIEQYRRAVQPARRGNRGGNRAGNRGEPRSGAADEADDTTSANERRQRERLAVLQKWEQALSELDYDQFNRTEQIDYHLLRHRLQSDRRRAEYQMAHPEYELPPVTDSSGISGQPIGKERLLIELEAEMIPYSPEELVKLAEQEYAWCQKEIKQAAQEMGFGDDWQAAVEKVKTLHVAPGEQPGLIRELAREAIDYLDDHELVSVPPLAAATWRMKMMSPERQLVSPFFLGGEVILVSFPTLTMQHADKLQSLRGNNIHFARATVHHELIPGHHLQGFMNARHRTYRQLFSTPFWLEGWALYWEFRLYDRGFPTTPEDRVGFLVWRSHRCARIIFSLNFHLGRMRPQECIDLLVARVGFEPNNAAAEVRRSLGTDYGPLYQAAYMLGGVQFRSLYQEFVASGKMSEQEFHDRILQEHAVPVAMVRAMLQDQPLEHSGPKPWRFYD